MVNKLKEIFEQDPEFRELSEDEKQEFLTKFIELNKDEQRKILRERFKEFNTLPPEHQEKFVNSLNAAAGKSSFSNLAKDVGHGVVSGVETDVELITSLLPEKAKNWSKENIIKYLERAKEKLTPEQQSKVDKFIQGLGRGAYELGTFLATGAGEAKLIGEGAKALMEAEKAEKIAKGAKAIKLGLGQGTIEGAKGLKEGGIKEGAKQAAKGFIEGAMYEGLGRIKNPAARVVAGAGVGAGASALEDVAQGKKPNTSNMLVNATIGGAIELLLGRPERIRTPKEEEAFNTIREEAKKIELEEPDPVKAYKRMKDVLKEFKNKPGTSEEFKQGIDDIETLFEPKVEKKGTVEEEIKGQPSTTTKESTSKVETEQTKTTSGSAVIDEKVNETEHPAKNVTELHAGVNPLEALKQLDKLGCNAINKMIDIIDKIPGVKQARTAIKKLYHELPYQSEEGQKTFYTALYGKLSPAKGKGLLTSSQFIEPIEQVRKNLTEYAIKTGIEKDKSGAQKTVDEFIVHYLENPEVRKAVKANPELKTLVEPLDKIRAHIDKQSKELLRRGLITPSQYKKHEGKYLTRLYNLNKHINEGEIIHPAKDIKEGRKIESIMDIAKEDREALGYVLNPRESVRQNILKHHNIIGKQDFFSELTKSPEIVDQRFLIDNPFAKMFKNTKLPEKISPLYVKKKIEPFIKDLIKNSKLDKETKRKLFKTLKELKKEAEIKEQALKRAKLGEDWEILKSGNGQAFMHLEGMPIRKDVAGHLKSLIKFEKESNKLPSKLDKVLTGTMTWFKIAKVPLNFKSYVRNFMGNIFQFTLETGKSPTKYLKELPLSFKSMLSKDKWYKEAQEMGLMGETLPQHEIRKIMEELHGKKGNKLVSAVMNISDKYGLIDDLAKLNTYRLMRKLGKSKLESAMIAQFAHYDYRITTPWARLTRDLNNNGDTLGALAVKLFAPFFPTFEQKSAQQFIKAIHKRPATTIVLIGTIMAAKAKIEDYFAKRYGDKYTKAYKPEWVRNNPFIVHLIDKDGNHYFVGLNNVLPFGWISDAITSLIKGDIGDAAKDVGIGSNPVLGAAVEAYSGRDTFTNKKIYDRRDEPSTKVLKWLTHEAYDILSPGSLNDLLKLATKRKDLATYLEGFFTGTNVYKLTPEKLERMKRYEKRRINSEFKHNVRELKAKLRSGKISRKEYHQKFAQLRKERDDKLRALNLIKPKTKNKKYGGFNLPNVNYKNYVIPMTTRLQ